MISILERKTSNLEQENLQHKVDEKNVRHIPTAI